MTDERNMRVVEFSERDLLMLVETAIDAADVALETTPFLRELLEMVADLSIETLESATGAAARNAPDALSQLDALLSGEELETAREQVEADEPLQIPEGARRLLGRYLFKAALLGWIIGSGRGLEQLIAARVNQSMAGERYTRPNGVPVNKRGLDYEQ